jgi:hypothetical protein
MNMRRYTHLWNPACHCLQHWLGSQNWHSSFHSLLDSHHHRLERVLPQAHICKHASRKNYTQSSILRLAIVVKDGWAHSGMEAMPLYYTVSEIPSSLEGVGAKWRRHAEQSLPKSVIIINQSSSQQTNKLPLRIYHNLLLTLQPSIFFRIFRIFISSPPFWSMISFTCPP